MVTKTQLYSEEQVKKNWLYQPLMVKINELWIKNGRPQRYSTYPDYESTFFKWNEENIGTWKDEKGRGYNRLLIAEHFDVLLEDLLLQIGKQYFRGSRSSEECPNDDWDMFLAEAEKLIENYHNTEIDLNDKTKERERRDLLRMSMGGEIPYQENIVFQFSVNPREFSIALKEVFFPESEVSKSTEIKAVNNLLNLDNGRLNRTIVKRTLIIGELPKRKIIIPAQRYTEVLKGIKTFENKPYPSMSVKIIENSKNKLFMVLFEVGYSSNRDYNDHKTIQLSRELLTEVKDVYRRVVKVFRSISSDIPTSIKRCIELSTCVFLIDKICEYFGWGWGVNIIDYAGILILGYSFFGEFVLKPLNLLFSLFSNS